MSRIGIQPIGIPAGVEVAVAGSTVTVKGKFGTLTQELAQGIAASKEENRLVVTRSGDDKRARAVHGLMRSLIRNHVVGFRCVRRPPPALID